MGSDMSGTAAGAVVLRAAGRRATAWSNGGGVTREVAAAPAGAGWDTFDWRVSLAEVTRDGPYSPLPGIDRILTVVDGAGLDLTVDGTRHTLPGRHRPFPFSGSAATDCRLLDGPVVNLNVMLRRGRARAEVELLRGERELPGAAHPVRGRSVLVVALEGRTEVASCAEGSGRGAPERLERFDAVLLPGGVPATARTDGVAALITVSAG